MPLIPDRQRFETVIQKARDVIAAATVADQAIVSAGDVYYSPEETNIGLKYPNGVKKALDTVYSESLSLAFAMHEFSHPSS